MQGSVAGLATPEKSSTPEEIEGPVAVFGAPVRLDQSFVVEQVSHARHGGINGRLGFLRRRGNSANFQREVQEAMCVIVARTKIWPPGRS